MMTLFFILVIVYFLIRNEWVCYIRIEWINRGLYSFYEVVPTYKQMLFYHPFKWTSNFNKWKL